MDINFKTRIKLFRLDDLNNDEKFRYLYSIVILLVFYSGFTSLWILSLMVNAPVLFFLAVILLAMGFALFFAIKNFNKVDNEEVGF